VKTGRTCSGQKNINAAFMEAVFNAVASDDEHSEPSTKVLDHRRARDEGAGGLAVMLGAYTPG